MTMATAAPFRWSGSYVGAQLGYSFARFSSYSTNLVGTFPVPFGHDVDTIRGGGHAGYNIRLGQFVLGLETDINFGAGDDERRTPAYGVVYTAKTKSDFDGSLRLRLGYAFDTLHAYGTGGLAFGDVTTDYGCIGCVNAATASYRVGDTRVGWTVGGGVEHALTDAVSARLEYRYTDLGGNTDIFPSPIVAISHDNTYASDQISFGLTYRFR
ncbi:MAG: outer membrane protein [Hyphomicrobium sp.]|uniref:outer membrane protein n=1 Tax=Hyphomicrobium sp. TaxID=82 RepID=UPI003D117F90